MWSASGESGSLEGTIRQPAFGKRQVSDMPPAGARRYRGSDVFDLYGKVQRGEIPAGHCIYALYRSDDIQEPVKVLRWATVAARVGEPKGGYLQWRAPNPEADKIPRPLSRSISIVVTAAPVDNPASLLRAPLAEDISSKVALPDRVHINLDESTESETSSEKLSMRLRGRQKTLYSQELEMLLGLVLLGRRDDAPRGKMTQLRQVLREPAPAPTISVATIDVQGKQEARSAIAGKRLLSPREDEASHRSFASMFADPAAVPGEPIRSADDVLRGLRTLIAEACASRTPPPDEQAAKPHTFQTLIESLSPELRRDFRRLQSEMVAMARTSRTHTKREVVDIDANDKLADGIDRWIDRLVAAVNESAGEEGDVDGTQIEALAWLYFLVRSEEINAASLHKELDELDDGKTHMQGEVYGGLARYGLSKREIAALLSDRDLDLIQYSPRTLWRVMKMVARFSDMRAQRWNIIGVVANFVMQGVARGISPIAYSNVTQGNTFNFAAFTEYWAATYVAGDVLYSNGKARTEKVLLHTDKNIQRSWLSRMVYGDSEPQSFDKMFNALVRGRDASSKIIGDSLNILGPAFMQVIAAAAVLFKFDPRLAISGLVSLPMMYLWSKHNNKKMEKLYREGNAEIDRTAERNRQYVNGAEDLQNFSSMEEVLDEIRTQFDNERTLEHGLNHRKAWQWFWSNLPMNLGILATVRMGVELGLPAGQILASTIAFGGLTYPIRMVAQKYFDEFPRQLVQALELVDQLGAIDAIDGPKGALERARIPFSQLEHHDVGFRNIGYSVLDEHGAEAPILEGVSFTVKQGEFVTLQGPSGSGKSTLVKKVGGIYKPTAGEITIGDVPREQIRQRGPDSLQEWLHYSGQHANFYDGTVFYNLNRDFPPAQSEEEIIERRAMIADLLKRLGFDTERFDLDRTFPDFVSGGERNRLSLIRAVANELLTPDPEKRGILMADEPTAGLDGVREQRVIELLEEVHAGGTTVITVTHNERLRKIGRSIDMDEFVQSA
ncbi:ATP-binding cassette domain-containing protein [Paraburkholderia sp. NMBU_R16]|uniref:ATP-binding cassette domain-containing protein n=1 Tax=Paraburkholderia sp. NMBU_R16 TaxID=2698676 RepID=UPI001564C7F5|nr:ABC transporter ATP-binding protein [Paraburkholderia sp. NMBU_R16]NRO98824.1 ATP-binding cassette domain-containing protein [Paraburkholderia sp. NMBU_R16]